MSIYLHVAGPACIRRGCVDSAGELGKSRFSRSGADPPGCTPQLGLTGWHLVPTAPVLSSRRSHVDMYLQTPQFTSGGKTFH